MDPIWPGVGRDRGSSKEVVDQRRAPTRRSLTNKSPSKNTQSQIPTLITNSLL